jgi:pimeloyl-ACP methyl ester carboxylesterase
MNNFEIKETAGNYRNGFVVNKTYSENVKIHFVEKNFEKNNGLSLVFSPGVWEPAERAIPLFEGLDCHCVSVSYRGRGKSDTPAAGYDLEHHVSDFKAVVDALNIDTFVLAAFSRGVGYACGYLDKYPEKVKGLIIVDHAPIHVKPWPGYAEYWKNLIYMGKLLINYMRPEALDGLQREARQVEFWDLLSRLTIPVVVLRGTSKKSNIPSELTEEDIIRYRQYVNNYCEIDFDYSGHMIVDEELGKYRSVVNEFIGSIAD